MSNYPKLTDILWILQMLGCRTAFRFLLNRLIQLLHNGVCGTAVEDGAIEEKANGHSEGGGKGCTTSSGVGYWVRGTGTSTGATTVLAIVEEMGEALAPVLADVFGEDQMEEE